MKVYAAWNKDKKIRMRSTSGGIFSLIAEHILTKDGYVSGAVLEFHDEIPKVCHIISNKAEDIERMRGSKYVQSKMNSTFDSIRRLLEENRYVLFTGTPCQVSGLKLYLQKTNTELKNLYCIDILCHGVSSPLIFHEYCNFQQNRYGAKLTAVNFRYKKPGWIVFSMYQEFENGKRYIKDKFKDLFLIGFLNDMYPRESCSRCPFTNLNREGDITLADFWGYKSESFRMRNNEKGINALLVNSTKGNELFNAISSQLVFEERAIEDVLGANKSYSMPWKANEKSEEFWREYRQNGWIYASNKYCVPDKLDFKGKFLFFVYRYWFLIPRFIRRLRNRCKRSGEKS